MTFEENAGIVPIAITMKDSEVERCELAAPEGLSLGKHVAVPLVAAALSLGTDDIVTAIHPPQVASVGLPFAMVELADRRALELATPDIRTIMADFLKGSLPEKWVVVAPAVEFAADPPPARESHASRTTE